MIHTLAQLPQTEPLTTAPTQGSTLLTIAIVVIVAAALLFLGYRQGWLKRIADRARAADLEFGRSPGDADAPRTSRTGEKTGYNLATVMERFATHPDFLRDRIQTFLDQADGLERLRTALEEANFEFREARKTGEIQHGIKIVAMTETQFRAIPSTLAQDILSRRSRPIMAVMSEPANSRRAPAQREPNLSPPPEGQAPEKKPNKRTPKLDPAAEYELVTVDSDQEVPA